MAMKLLQNLRRIVIISSCLLLCLCDTAYGQQDTVKQNTDSSSASAIEIYEYRMRQIEAQRVADSIRRADLEERLQALRTSDKAERKKLEEELNTLKNKETERLLLKKAKIDSLRQVLKGYPVIGMMRDTLFFVHNRSGSLSAAERAAHIGDMIRMTYKVERDHDSLALAEFENGFDVVAGDLVLLTVTETDALWYDTTARGLASKTASLILNDLQTARKEYSFTRQLTRSGLVALAIVCTITLIWFIGRIYRWLKQRMHSRENKWLSDKKYKGYTYLTHQQQVNMVDSILRVARILLIILTLYISLPIIFSIFPFTRGWADKLFDLIWSPVRSIALKIWNYLPNVFTIAVILFVMYHANKGIKYFFKEIEYGKLHFPGFFPDWAMPTYGIIRMLLIAFTIVLVFPYLPGSDSDIFKGVSVFVGILFSLGSSSAIANMVAGLVITYMRPFKPGDRVQIAGITGDVLERTLLVTRLKTTKNEEITIPNASVLTNNTINYSTLAEKEGLILHTAVTIGYDVSWRKMHEALIEAALRTERVDKEPSPFVLQTSLDDFYVSYQLNAYTKAANSQASVYSELHQHIQDVCAEMGIEIMSPHYRAERDGSATTIPPTNASGSKAS